MLWRVGKSTRLSSLVPQRQAGRCSPRLSACQPTQLMFTTTRMQVAIGRDTVVVPNMRIQAGCIDSKHVNIIPDCGSKLAALSMRFFEHGDTKFKPPTCVRADGRHDQDHNGTYKYICVMECANSGFAPSWRSSTKQPRCGHAIQVVLSGLQPTTATASQQHTNQLKQLEAQAKV